MDNQKEYSCLEHHGKIFSKQVDLESDYQEALPAYCDDIYSVVKCCGRSYITSAEINYNEIKISGKSEICLTYFNDNSSLCYVDFEEDFVKTINAEGLTDYAYVCADIFDKYTNFRVINQRRIDIHISSVIKINVYDKITCPSLCSCENSKLRIEKIKTADFINSNISKIEFDESFNLTADNEPIKRVISYSGFVSPGEIKIIKDKALAKAVISVNIIYTSDTDEENICNSQYSFNVSKIVEVQGINENNIPVANVKIANLIVKAKANGGERLNTFDVFGEVILNTVFINETEQELITDGYIPNYNSDCDYSDYSLNGAGEYVNDNKLVNLSFVLPDDVVKVIEVSLNIGDIHFKNGTLITGVLMNTVCENSNGELTSISSIDEFELSYNGYNEAVSAVSINSYDYSISNSNTLDIRLNANFSLYLYNKKCMKLLSDISEGDRIENTPAVTVYFGKADESVWNIAKNFSSDTETIINENALKSDTLDTDRVLIIPRV